MIPAPVLQVEDMKSAKLGGLDMEVEAFFVACGFPLLLELSGGWRERICPLCNDHPK